MLTSSEFENYLRTEWLKMTGEEITQNENELFSNLLTHMKMIHFTKLDNSSNFENAMILGLLNNQRVESILNECLRFKKKELVYKLINKGESRQLLFLIERHHSASCKISYSWFILQMFNNILPDIIFTVYGHVHATKQILLD